MNKKQIIATLCCLTAIAISLMFKNLIWLRVIAVAANFSLLIALQGKKAKSN
jgi:hypothetical protein